MPERLMIRAREKLQELANRLYVPVDSQETRAEKLIK